MWVPPNHPSSIDGIFHINQQFWGTPIPGNPHLDPQHVQNPETLNPVCFPNVLYNYWIPGEFETKPQKTTWIHMLVHVHVRSTFFLALFHQINLSCFFCLHSTWPARHQLLQNAAGAQGPSPRTAGRSVSPMRSASPLQAAARPRSTSPVNGAIPPAASRLQQPRVVVARPAKHAAVADRVAAYVEPTTLNQKSPSFLDDQLDVGGFS